MSSITLLITRHAKEKMIIHGVNMEQVRTAITRGAKVRQTEGWLASYCYLKVAYRKIGAQTYKIKTVFVEQ